MSRQHQSSLNATSLEDRVNMKLGNLPLRPSTLSTFISRGFTTTAEIDAAKRSSPSLGRRYGGTDGNGVRSDGGGISNLASELGCSLPETFALQVRIVD